MTLKGTVGTPQHSFHYPRHCSYEQGKIFSEGYRRMRERERRSIYWLKWQSPGKVEGATWLQHFKNGVLPLTHHLLVPTLVFRCIRYLATSM